MRLASAADAGFLPLATMLTYASLTPSVTARERRLTPLARSWRARAAPNAALNPSSLTA